MMRKTLAPLAFLAAMTGCGPMVYTGGSGTSVPTMSNGDQLVSAMRNRYSGRWYNTITFIQKSTYYRADGSILRTETWYEAGQFPGQLRIDLGVPSLGNGVLYRNDSTYQFQGGRLTDRRVGSNPLLVLGFDVYAQPAARTANQLRLEGINLSTIRADSLDGRRVWVVGAAKGDSTSNQFWVDAERLLFVRLIQTQQGRTRDIRFERYTQYGGGWVAEVVRFYSGGRLTFLEEYSQVRVNESLDASLFVPERWSSASHWYRQ
jgi:hypothetical protein